MGLSSSKTKTTQDTNQAQSGTTMPITPDWLTEAAQDYVGRIGAYGDMDPNSFIAGASPLQQQAWQNADQLGGWRGQAATAAQMALGAGQGGASFAGIGGGSSGKAPAGTGGIFQPPAPETGPAYQATASGYNAPRLATPGLVSGQGYSAPQVGNASGYAAARSGSPIGAAVSGYNPTQASAAQVQQTPGATASNADAASLLTNFSAYQNPYDTQVRQAALSDFDNQAAQQRAALEARGAQAVAFGGSRFGIAQGQMEGDLARGRASLDAGLLDQGFNTAAGLSQYDASNRQQTGLFNAQNSTQNSQFNSGLEANRALAQAGYDQSTNLANQASSDAAGQFYAGGLNAAGLQYADAANRSALDYAGRQDTAASQLSGAQNQFGLAQAGLNENAARYGADSNMQAALANQSMLGQYGLAQGQLDASAGQFNAGAQNAASAQNALANNQMSQFNAGQQDNAFNRQLAAAGLLGQQASQYGADTRADLGTMAQLGDQQRGIEQAYAASPLAQLQMMGNLSGMTPYQILVGNQVDTTGTSHSTGTQTSSPSLFNTLLQLGQTAAMFA